MRFDQFHQEMMCLFVPGALFESMPIYTKLPTPWNISCGVEISKRLTRWCLLTFVVQSSHEEIGVAPSRARLDQ